MFKPKAREKSVGVEIQTCTPCEEDVANIQGKSSREINDVAAMNKVSFCSTGRPTGAVLNNQVRAKLRGASAPVPGV